jgi:23S rRNA (uracil1939-C5)-methyltransferase
MRTELVIDSLAAGGDGVARDVDGRVVFVSGAAVGDRLLCEVVASRKRFARAEIVRVLSPSPDRIEPECALARECGGCQWLHIAPAGQRVAKQAILAAALRHEIAAGLELEPLIEAAPPLGWRRRARLHWVRRRRSGRLVLGFFRRGSQEVVDAPHCPQLDARLQVALAAVRARLAGELFGKGEIAAVVGHGGQVHVSITGACPSDAPVELLGVAGIAGVRAGRRAWGLRAIELEPGLHSAADEFAQASEAGNRALCELVDRAAQPRQGARVLELYAGAGNLTRSLVRGPAELVAVDVVAPQRPVAGATVRVGPAAEVVAALVKAADAFDLVVLDPPRSGAADVVPGLLALGPERIVYVSCDPATLARDLEALRRGGYRPRRARGIDTMPQTAHVETIVVLERSPQTA